MFANNPFSILAESVSPILMQSFVILMGLLVIAGTLMDIIHKKNVKYFFNNAKKAKKSATKNLTTGERISVISKTIASDIATTSELGAGKRRLAHVMGYVWYNSFLDSISCNDFLLLCTTISNSISLADNLACWCSIDCFRRILVLVLFESRCLF